MRLFDLQIDGVTVKANVNAGSTRTHVVSPGSHTVGETGGTGTSLGSFFTVISGDCTAQPGDRTGTITLAAGDVKACTIIRPEELSFNPLQSVKSNPVETIPCSVQKASSF